MAKITINNDGAKVPTEPSTRSFWHNQLDNTLPDRSKEDLPQQADYVVIGSGLTGALIAYNLKRTLPANTSIVILEARFAVSGATGRNGGHIKPGRIHSFDSWERSHGTQLAIKQVALEKANHEETVRFIEEEGLVDEVELVQLRAVDVCMNEKALAKIQTCWTGLKRAGVDTSDMEFLQGSAAANAFRIPRCLAGVSYPAASLWPYKLAIALLKKAEKLGARLYTQTTVQSIDSKEGSQPWVVHTSRGSLFAKNVIHATNGYASSILPEANDRLVPCKGHAAAMVPPSNYWDSPLQTSFGIEWGEDFDYIIQRNRGGKHLIYGGRDLDATGDPTIGIGDSDDSFVYPEHVGSLKRFPGLIFEYWNQTDEHEMNAQVWCGIMGFVVDDLPYVGAVPGKPGQFICAGYNGSGMARAFLCTQALCQLIRGEQIDSRIPDKYFDLDKRWASGKTWSSKYGENTSIKPHL